MSQVSRLMALGAALALLPGAARGSSIIETTDFPDDVDTTLQIGSLAPGDNFISGSLATTCVAAPGDFADCTGGDELDSGLYGLPSGFEVSAVSVAISNGSLSGNLLDLDLAAIQVTVEIFEGGTSGVSSFLDGTTIETFPSRLSFSLDRIIFEDRFTIGLLSGSRFPVLIQGTGDASFDYVATITVTAVPEPASGLLLGVATFSAMALRRRAP